MILMRERVRQTDIHSFPVDMHFKGCSSCQRKKYDTRRDFYLHKEMKCLRNSKNKSTYIYQYVSLCTTLDPFVFMLLTFFSPSGTPNYVMEEEALG